MRIFNLVYKTKYIVALALLLAFAVFVVPAHIGETFAKPETPNFPVKSNAFFDYVDISASFIAPERTEFFGRFEGVKELKQRHGAVRQEKLLPVTKTVLEKYINSVYANLRIPFYTELCTLLAQLIVIYIFMTDGKKRMLKLSYKQLQI